jgi:DNA-binding response OmpR family regulator
MRLSRTPGGVMTSAFVVDDDKLVSALVATWLAKAGYAVKTCGTFAEAKRQIMADSPPVLVVDVRLEGFNGIHLAILARQLNPNSRIVVLSGYDDPVLRRDAMALGAVYLLKPLNSAELLAAIESGGRAEVDAGS